MYLEVFQNYLKSYLIIPFAAACILVGFYMMATLAFNEFKERGINQKLKKMYTYFNNIQVSFEQTKQLTLSVLATVTLCFIKMSLEKVLYSVILLFECTKINKTSKVELNASLYNSNFSCNLYQ